MFYILASALSSFLPGLLASNLLPLLSTNLPSLFPPAPKGSPTYIRNYRITFTGIIVIWQAYTLLREGIGEDEWYSQLGVSSNVDDVGLKNAFRALARKYHPDKIEGNDDHFISARKSYENLSDPVKRYAYDRFGPSIVEWKAKSIREYIMLGLQQSMGFYLISGGIMLMLTLLGRAQAGSLYIKIIFVLLFVVELQLILYPVIEEPTILSQIFVPPTLLYKPQFIIISLLHRMFTSLSVSLNQLVSVWSGEGTERARALTEWRAIINIAKQLNQEAIGDFLGDVVPLLKSGDPQVIESLLKKSMEDVLFDRTLANHPATAEVYKKALTRAEVQLSASSLFSPRQSLRLQAKRNTGSQISDQPRKLQNESTSSSLDSMNTNLHLAMNIPLPPSPPPTPRQYPRDF
ncbi:hypothetical protein L204_100572 [Cryptococcus depauperatus]|nr:hypothetical protein L204_01495 [Cryptococcus depauperatus CBS 7855]